MYDAIAAMPTVELHLHIEGSFEPELMFKIAQRNRVSIPFDSVDAVRAAYRFNNLQEFLNIYYQGMQVLRTEQDFYDLTAAYLKRAAADNVRHTEIFFDPQAHVSRDVPFDTVVGGIHRALKKAERTGMTSSLIMCFLRDQPVESAMEMLERAKDHKDKIIGVGLDSAEVGHPPSKFRRVFEKAGDEGFHRVAHAGEEGPPDYVWSALWDLQVERIDHGNRALEDIALVEYLRERRIPLTVCPLSNTALRVVKDMKDHPLPIMLQYGLKATLNSDDPAYFGGYMDDNLRAVYDARLVSFDDLIQMQVNAIDASFASPARMAQLKAELVRFAGVRNHSPAPAP